MSDEQIPPEDEAPPPSNVVDLGAAKARKRKPREERHPNAPPADFARGDHWELARELLLDLEADAERLVFDYDKLHRYDPDAGTWKALEEKYLTEHVGMYAGKTVESDRGKPKVLKVTRGTIDDVVEIANRRRKHQGFFDGRANGVVFRNGFVTVGPDNIVIVPHAPEHRAREAMPFDYDGATPYPRWQQFLEDTFRDDEDRAEKVRLVQQFFGMCLLGLAPRMQVALVLLGEGANGKSVLLDVLAGAFPHAERAAAPPQLWGDEKIRASLAGVRLNAVNELPIRDILEGSWAKQIITGEPTQARNLYVSSFTFRPIAGHIFSTNTLPSVSDRSHGFWRRWPVLTFNRVLPRSEWNETLAAELLRDELAGIVGWGLAGAADYMARGLAMPPSSIEATAIWRKESNPVALWLEEDTVPLTATEISWWKTATTLLQAFNAWAKRNGHKEVSTTKFGRDLVRLGVEKRHTDRGSVYRLDLRAREPG